MPVALFSMLCHYDFATKGCIQQHLYQVLSWNLMGRTAGTAVLNFNFFAWKGDW